MKAMCKLLYMNNYYVFSQYYFTECSWTKQEQL